MYIKSVDTILQNLGFDSFFEKQCEELRIETDDIARVIAEHKGVYFIKNSGGDFQARITGKRMFTATGREDYPAVGDWVVIETNDSDQTKIIKQILPRRTIIRKTVVSRQSPDKVKSQIIAANVDVAFVVESVDRDYSLTRFERYFALLEEGNVRPSIILNKVDLISRDELNNKIAEIRERFKDCTVIPTSTTSLEALDSLRDSLQSGKTYCLLGSSGVGKSSLINALIGEDTVKTGDIGRGTGRGKHVTTHREMYFLKGGGVIIDNPGMREVGSANSQVGVKVAFDEIVDLATQCQFSDCSHTHESGCAVLKAVDMGTLDNDRYDNYIQLKKEADHCEMNDYEKRGKEKKFGKYKKNSLKRMEEFE